VNQMTDPKLAATNPMLRVTDLTHRVSLETDTLTILQGVSLEINRGESVAIVGRSGSGKTTLLGLLAGLDTPTEGKVELDGAEISSLTEDQRAQLRASRVGFVFQSFQLLPALSALENVMLPLELAGMESPEARAKELLERVGLGERLSHTPRQLSGGEQQRVAIARAFASDPVILFADEPTGNLDNRTGQAVSDLLMDLNREQGTTLVMVTHDEHLAARCGRQLHIEAGVLTEPEAARELAD
jgi:putative ABC transport system ATP-binding protein